METLQFKKNTTKVLSQKEKIVKRIEYVQYRIDICEKYLFDDMKEEEKGKRKFYAYNQSLECFTSEKEFLTDLLREL